jgi:hypothetical protein
MAKNVAVRDGSTFLHVQANILRCWADQGIIRSCCIISRGDRSKNIDCSLDVVITQNSYKVMLILHPLVDRHFSRYEVFCQLSKISIVIPSKDDFYGRRGGGLKVHGQLDFSSNCCFAPIVSGDWLLIY